MDSKVTIDNFYTKRKNKLNEIVIDTTSKSKNFYLLSPFRIGPVDLYDGLYSLNIENAWQFSKVYRQHVDSENRPTNQYWEWATNGWKDSYAHRYPMGKGAIPLYSLWKRKYLDYITARKQIYGPLYSLAVRQTNHWTNLVKAYENYDNIVLLDYDGYDHDNLGMTLSQVLNCRERKMGHAFVLKMLLTNDPCLYEMEE